MKHTFSRLGPTVLLAGLLSGVAVLPALAAEPAAPPTTQFTLANGLTVIVKPDRRAPTAVHMLWVRVGAMDEVDGTSGVAHVLEHMMFKGTDTLAPGEFSRKVAALGGRENAFTSRDYTGYYQQIPADRLEDVMKLESDRFAHNRWSDDEFKREVEVVKEERRLRTEDAPRARMDEVLDAVTFIASPYRRPVIGWMSDIDALKPDDVRNFYQHWYVPANAAVVVAGDVDPAAVRVLAERYYGAIPARPVPPRKPREEPPQQGLRRIEFKAPAEQAYLQMAFKAPRLTGFAPLVAEPPALAVSGAGTAAAKPPARVDEGEDALALTVLAAVLDGYRGARLDRGLTQGPDRVADSAGAGNGLLGRGPQLFVLDAVPAAGKTTAQAEGELRAQVARVAQGGVTVSELKRVKTQWIASQVYQRDSLFAQARSLGSFWALGLPLDADEQLIARLRAITAAQVQHVAGTYFNDDQLSVGVLVPQPIDPSRPPRIVPAGALHSGEQR